MSDVENSADASDSLPSASKVLQQARESMGLSIKDVADQLFLSTSHIDFLEKEEFDRFPKKAFIKGYLRSYARVVQLDGEDIVRLYEASFEAEQEEEENQLPEQDKRVEVHSGQTIMRVGFVGLGVLLLVMLILWFAFREAGQVNDQVEESITDLDSIDRSMAESTSDLTPESIKEPQPQVDSSQQTQLEPQPDQPTTVALIEDTSSLAEEVIDEAANEVTDEDLSIEESVDASAGEEVDQAEESLSDAQRLAALKEIELERVRERDVEYIVLRAGGEQELLFNFDDECWVEVIDGDGALIYTDLNRRGDVLKVYGKAPFDILFGKASAVRLKFNGDEVDFQDKIRTDLTARVNLGTLGG